MAACFRDEQTKRLLESGWQSNAGLREHLRARGLPCLQDALEETMTAERWRRAEDLVDALRERFQQFRFAPDVEYGVLLVPNPRRLDTRAPLPAGIRALQDPTLTGDVAARGLPPGKELGHRGRAWLPVATVLGRYGLSAGSYLDVVGAPAAEYTVAGHDTRRAMTRQMWGARLLQASPGSLPDHDAHPVWTFTLFPAEDLVDGQAESGTVLKGKVRYRLGKPNRGIGSARIAPAIPL